MKKTIGVIAAMLSLVLMIMAGCSSGSDGNRQNQGGIDKIPNDGNGK